MQSVATLPDIRRRPACPAGAPTAAPEALDWLPAGDRPLDWNGPTDRPFIRLRDADLERPIIDHLERVARRQPERTALTDCERRLSYGALWDGLSGLAETIGDETRPGELIAILLPAGALYTLAMLACLAAGRPFVALDPAAPAEWLGEVLADARPALVIGGGEDVLNGVDLGARRPRLIALTDPPKPARKGWRPARLDVDEPACVLFTSGSTGRPKGVVNSQRALLQRALQSINAAHINAEDRLLTLASPGGIVGVRDAVTALLAGGSIRLIDPQRAAPRDILKAMRAEASTIVFAFPVLLRSLVAHGGEAAGTALRLVRAGGDTTLWGDIDTLSAWLAPRARIQLVYAATEAPMMQWFVDRSCRGEDARIPIGYPLPGNRLTVIDEAGCATPPGEVGELVVGGPHVALGRWRDGRCVADGPASGRVFRTGDLARVRPDGLLERLGRKDRQVKIRGARVELDGVEAALRRHPHVRDVGALARTAADGGPTLVAYVSAGEGALPGLLDELKALMRRSPAPMRPARLYLTPEIPRLPSSKLDVCALTALDEARLRDERAAVAEADPAGGDEVARTVARAWREALRAPVGGPDEDFFDAGGDSLKAVALMLALEQALGGELCLSLIHEAPTFAGLCAAIRARQTAGYVPLVALKDGDGLPPVFFIHGVGGNVADLFAIARSLNWPGPVIGIQARGLARQDAPHPTVEAMAADYLSAIKARQPDGPYYLCGYSFGGLVAFEMARRLWAAGDEVGLVGLFDTLPNPLGWPLALSLACARRRMARLVAEMRAAPVTGWPAAARRAGGRLHHSLNSLLSQTPDDAASIPSFLRSAPGSVLKVAASAALASARYRPGFYPGELKLFTPAERDPALPAPQAVWRRHAGVLSVVATAGDHLTMLAKPNAATTAASLARCLPA